MKIATLLLSLGSAAAFAPSQPSQRSFALRADAEAAESEVPVEADPVAETLASVTTFSDFKDEIGVVPPVSFSIVQYLNITLQ